MAYNDDLRVSTWLGVLDRVTSSTKGSRMKRLFAVAVVFTSGLVLGFYFRGDSPTVIADDGGGAPACSFINGDVNASGEVDLSDAVIILSFLFLGAPTALVPQCALPTGPPDTGQSTDYDERGEVIERSSDRCRGQDGSYATGCRPQGRFADNGDGTVTDNCTRLMWQKHTAEANGDGNLNDQDRVLWCVALAYCENLSFAGHDDWRLPNVRELQSIPDYGQRKPAIAPVFSAFSYAYWTSTSYWGNPRFAWYVDFLDGIASFDLSDVDSTLVGGGPRSKGGGLAHVRAVRNAP
jgi:hypothetical protein